MVKANGALPKLQDQSAVMSSTGVIDLNTMGGHFK